MADEEFIILLGDEPEEGAGSAVAGVKGEAGSPNAKTEDEGFVVLLGEADSEGENCRLSSDLVIADAGSLYQFLAEIAAETEGDITIDASGVEQVDSAGLQLLALFRRSLLKANRKVNYLGFSGDINVSISQAGFASLLAA